jgi:hypothetical protein
MWDFGFHVGFEGELEEFAVLGGEDVDGGELAVEFLAEFAHFCGVAVDEDDVMGGDVLDELDGLVEVAVGREAVRGNAAYLMYS